MLVVLIIDLARGLISFPLTAAGLAVGLVVGVIVSRMYRLRYDEDARRVMGQIDGVGVAILLAYIVFVFTRNQLFAGWTEGANVAAFSLSVTAGTMLGRLVGTAQGIRRVLTAWGVATGN